MDQDEKIELKRQYEKFADDQIIQMLAEGAGSFVEGAYELLRFEAERRRLPVANDAPPAAPLEENNKQPEKDPSHELQPDINTYVQLIIVNDDSDLGSIESIFNKTDIPYYFQNLNIRPDKSLPVGFMVDNARAEDAVELLRNFRPTGSIILW
jgi:hypothetical protein